MNDRSDNAAFIGLMRLGWIAAVLIVFWQATLSNPAAATTQINDKLGHFLVFFVLCYWGGWAWKQQQARYYLVGFLLLFGLAIECVQYVIPMRHFSLMDWLADIGGVVFCQLIWRQPIWVKKQASK